MTKLVLDPTIKFAHFPEHGLAIGYRMDDATQTLTYARSLTHTNDTYNHRIARGIVQGRILKGGNNAHGRPRNFVMTYDTLRSLLKDKPIKHQNIVEAILQFLAPWMYTSL